MPPSLPRPVLSAPLALVCAQARVARGVVAGLVAVLGGLAGAIGMLALGVRHTGKVSVFVWRQLGRWAWLGPAVRPPPPPAQEASNGAAATAATHTNGKGGAVGLLASAASLPQNTLTAQAGGGVRLSMSSVVSVDSQGLGSVAEEDEEDAPKDGGKHASSTKQQQQQQQQQQQGPQRSGNSDSSDGDAEAAPQCTATLACDGGASGSSGSSSGDKAAPAGGQHAAAAGNRCTPLACLRWAAVLPLYPFVPLAVLGFFLLTSLTWLLGGFMLSLAGAWRATTWSGRRAAQALCRCSAWRRVQRSNPCEPC